LVSTGLSYNFMDTLGKKLGVVGTVTHISALSSCWLDNRVLMGCTIYILSRGNSYTAAPTPTMYQYEFKRLLKNYLSKIQVLILKARLGVYVR
jgi:hypothetical protein